MSKIYVDNTKCTIDNARKEQMYHVIKERVESCDFVLPEEFLKMRDFSFVCLKEKSDSLNQIIQKTASDIVSSGACEECKKYAQRVLTLCAAVKVLNADVTAYLNEAAAHLSQKMKGDSVALICDAVGEAAIYLNDRKLLDKCIEITATISKEYKAGKRQNNMLDAWEECSHIAHFNSKCLEYGIAMEELNYKFYVDMVKWYVQNLYDAENVKWLHSECDGICPPGDMLIHIACLKDDVIFRNMLRNKGLARYLFDLVCEKNGAYGEYTYRNIENSVKPYNTFEATLAEFDIFKNGDIIIRDEYPVPCDTVGILSDGTLKYVASNVYMMSVVSEPFDKVLRAEIVDDCCVVITEKNDKTSSVRKVRMYILNLPSIVVVIDYVTSSILQKNDNVFMFANECASLSSENNIIINKSKSTMNLTEAYLLCDGKRHKSEMHEDFENGERKVYWRSLANEKMSVYVAVADAENMAVRQNIKEEDNTISITTGGKKQMLINISDNVITIIHQDGLKDEYTL